MSEEGKEDVRKFLRQQFPQIQFHGGAAEILEANTTTGQVYVVLGGACKGCGLSPMTIEALNRRMPEQIDWVEEVTISAEDYF